MSRTACLPALLAATLAITAGCPAPPENSTAFIEGVLALDPTDGCVVDGTASVFTSSALLDIGIDATSANSLVLAPKAVLNLPNTFSTQRSTSELAEQPNYPTYGYADNNAITFTAAEVFYSTDADRPGDPELDSPLPINDASARRIGVGGSVFNEQQQLLSATAVITTAITAQDAAQLQVQPFVQNLLAAANATNNPADNRARILVNLRLTGFTSGNAPVRTPPFVFPVDLCAGCLVDVGACDPGETLIDSGCTRGVDFPSACP